MKKKTITKKRLLAMKLSGELEQCQMCDGWFEKHRIVTVPVMDSNFERVRKRVCSNCGINILLDKVRTNGKN